MAPIVWLALLLGYFAGLGGAFVLLPGPVIEPLYGVLGLVTLLLTPAALSIGVFGYSMGPFGGALFVLFAAMQIALGATLFSVRLLQPDSANGLYLLLITLHTLLVLALPYWGYAALAIAWLPLGFRFTARGFDRFTAVTERRSIEQLA